MRAFVAPFGLALLCGGCFVYVPVGSAPPDAGNYVRAELTPEGSEAVIPQLGPDVDMVSGVAAAPTPAALPIAVQYFRIRNQGERPFNEALLHLQPQHISLLQVKRFSKLRTAVFIGGIIAGGLLLDRTLGGAFFGSDEKPGPRDPI